jgi:hypothetical protein
LESQKSINNLRRQMLEDKIFEIQLIAPEKRSDADRARLDRYTRDLDAMNTANRRIGILQSEQPK